MVADNIVSLYRSYIRQVRRLPNAYLQLFFRIKVADDFRAILRSSNHIYASRVRRVKQELLKVEAANAGRRSALVHVLDIAYGRKGKFRWELMKPLLSDPGAPLPSRIIPAVEKSRPPTYSPELSALLTSGQSRTTKALEKRHLLSPPTLPARADPYSEDARLLGPFSKRREVNIRWRYFSKQSKKVWAPLQVVAVEKSDSHEIIHEGSDSTALIRAGIRGIGLQGTGVFEELEVLARHTRKIPNLTRREKRICGDVAGGLTYPDKYFIRSRRWLQRRYGELLGRIPILTHVTSGKGKTYEVSSSWIAIATHRLDIKRLPGTNTAELAWSQNATFRDRTKEDFQMKNVCKLS